MYAPSTLICTIATPCSSCRTHTPPCFPCAWICSHVGARGLPSAAAIDTATLAWDALAGDIATALNGFASVAGNASVTGTVGNWVTPFPGDKWTMVCGYTDDPRMFKVQRNGAIVLSYKESGTASMIGADYRGIGFGVRAGHDPVNLGASEGRRVSGLRARPASLTQHSVLGGW